MNFLVFDGIRQLDIVKFALPLAKISFHPIFAVVGKHTNFFMSNQAASQPYLITVTPPMYGTKTSGMVTLPSSFW